MNLLVRAMLGLRRLATPDAGFTLLVAGVALAVEVLGRQSPSDLHDLLALFSLSMLGMIVVARHRRSPLPWVVTLNLAGERLLESAKGQTFQMGLDLRGTPPVKSGFPSIVRVALLVLAVLGGATLAAAPWLPHALRYLAVVSYLIYLAVLAVLWVLLAASILLAAFVPMAVVHDAFVVRHRGPGRRTRRGEAAALAAYFGALFLIGAALPLWSAYVATWVLLACYVSGCLLSRRDAVRFLWRPRNSIRVRSLTWGQWVFVEFTIIGLLVLALTQFACGSLMRGDETGVLTMPLTALMGVALAWLGPGLLAVLCLQMVLGLRRDPARPARPVAFLRDHTGANRQSLRQLFRKQGWEVRFAPRAADPLDVPIELVSELLPRQGPAQEFPLAVTPAGLERDGLFVRLARRDEVQRRRRFFAGLEHMLKVAGSKPRGGVGYWLSPHLWFVAGLMRDDRDAEFDLNEEPILSSSVGPPYQRVFPRAVRYHLYQILRGTSVDLIFIEDGVSFKRLRRVLRVLFEVYDIHAGRRPAEEIDFRGLPGTRVLIHDFQFDEPFRSGDYPEPKYEFLGRARILHVFKDRGGDEDLVEPPFDFGRRPAPAGAM